MFRQVRSFDLPIFIYFNLIGVTCKFAIRLKFMNHSFKLMTKLSKNFQSTCTFKEVLKTCWNYALMVLKWNLMGVCKNLGFNSNYY